MYLDDGVRRRLPRAGWSRRALLQNYLAEAKVLARSGGGTLWLVEPRLTAERLRVFTAAVAGHLAAHGVRTGEVTLLAESTSARIRVLGG